MMPLRNGRKIGRNRRKTGGDSFIDSLTYDDYLLWQDRENIPLHHSVMDLCSDCIAINVVNGFRVLPVSDMHAIVCFSPR